MDGWMDGLKRFRLAAVVHRHGQSELEFFVEHFSTERHALAEHVHGHQAQGLAVHQESVAVDLGKAVDLGHVTNPGLDILAEPRTGI